MCVQNLIAPQPEFVYDFSVRRRQFKQEMTETMATSFAASNDAERRLVDLKRLVDLSLVLNSTLALEPLLQRIMDAACDLVDTEASSILLMDKDTRQLFFAASNSGGTEGLIGRPVPLEGSIAGLILKEKRPVALDDVRQHPSHYRQLDQQIDFETRSLLGVPMRIKDSVVGVLEVVNKRNGTWTDDDREEMSIIAAQAAVAIENARLVGALRKAYDELDQLDRLKNDFIAIASHELRTPLGVILGYASFLKEDSQGEASEHAEVVYRSALKLRSIIEQMTNLRYLKLGQTELNREKISVADLLHMARQDIASLADAKEHNLTIVVPTEVQFIYVDGQKIITALSNLLNNAVRFTPAGGTIRVDSVVQPGEVWIRVADNGIGIPADQLEKIFDEFYQVENHLTRRHGGMGLGLSIARGLIEAHGGRIWAESPGPDQGSTFYVSLPLADQ